MVRSCLLFIKLTIIQKTIRLYPEPRNSKMQPKKSSRLTAKPLRSKLLTIVPDLVVKLETRNDANPCAGSGVLRTRLGARTCPDHDEVPWSLGEKAYCIG
jgi:hypothetical protein